MVDSNTAIIILDNSIKNNIAISITYVHSYIKLVKKTIYHTVNITTMKAELFAIRYGIN